MPFEIHDAKGQRIVYARDTSGEAIDVIASAVAGQADFPTDRREAWLRLCDQFGLHVVEIELPPNPT